MNKDGLAVRFVTPRKIKHIKRALFHVGTILRAEAHLQTTASQKKQVESMAEPGTLSNTGDISILLFALKCLLHSKDQFDRYRVSNR